MRLDPFIGGLSIGALATMGVFLACNIHMRKTVDMYEAMLDAREKRIRRLIAKMDKDSLKAHGKEMLRETVKPLGGGMK